jgi:subfamily B ATP-binding cassette protein MsbA
MEPLGDLLELLGLVLVVWYGGHLIMADQISTGTLVAFIAYMEILARPLGHAEAYYRSAQSSRAVGTRLLELFADRATLPVIGHGAVPARLAISFDRVSFRHEGGDRDILREVSFAVEPGEVVAIAGRNGAGKSSLMDLLLRFYDPSEGCVLIDGTDLRQIDLPSWRGSVGIMGQDVFLFHGTIMENIGYGRPGASAEEVAQAVELSGLHHLLQKFPKGLHTVVGERGTQLSGGERQSIALARLFLRKPKLLILDEPTSQLDGEALQHVLAALRALTRDCTTFMVTHNLETIYLARRVLFLEAGRLRGNAAHDELYAQNTNYKALWETDRKRNPRAEASPPLAAVGL